MMTDVEREMERKLRAAFDPAALVIENDSHRHAGHAGSPGTGTSHFTVTMASEAFRGTTRVDRQRKVYAVLADELAGPVHALALKLSVPGD
ncbi:MAG: BolA family protein [Pseudomonadota bacterium]|nr:BolA family protein [Pseudomonadota bacterium]